MQHFERAGQRNSDKERDPSSKRNRCSPSRKVKYHSSACNILNTSRQSNSKHLSDRLFQSVYFKTSLGFRNYFYYSCLRSHTPPNSSCSSHYFCLPFGGSCSGRTWAGVRRCWARRWMGASAGWWLTAGWRCLADWLWTSPRSVCSAATAGPEIGRASCRGRVWISVVAVSLKKQNCTAAPSVPLF